jgi:hypothetical protein
LEFRNIRTFNWENALRGMRNPKESYDRIDSQYGIAPYDAYEDVVNTFI